MKINIHIPAQTLELLDDAGRVLRRYIYIHGTPDSTPLGQPGSRGCVRMRNADLVELFDLVPAGTEVNIIA